MKTLKLPPCGHRNLICDQDHCRMQYAIKEPKGKLPPLDKTFKHRDKVVKRIREIELNKLDAEIHDMGDGTRWWICEIDYKGEYSKQKQRQARYERIAWRVLWTLSGGVLLASLVI